MKEGDNQNIIENMIRNVIGCCIGMLWGTLLCVVIAMMSSCSKQQYIPSSTLITDTVYRMNIVRDTVLVKDSVLVSIISAGDTVYKTREVWRWRDRVNVRADTVYKYKNAVRVDTVRVPVAVERKLSWWERTVERPLQQVMAVFIAIACIMGVLYVAVRLRQRRSRDTERND